jgi:hypothetical protein
VLLFNGWRDVGMQIEEQSLRVMLEREALLMTTVLSQSPG